MSFQAYMDTIEAKTGKKPADFRRLARERGLETYGETVAWLKAEFALGHGHANAMAHVILETFDHELTIDEQIAKHFAGGKAPWRKSYDELIAAVETFGPDIGLSPSSSYISIVRSGKKFAIVQVTSKRLDVGIKLKDAAAEGRFEAAGAWNAMVTHRVRVSDPGDVDAELLSWLRRAYEGA
jgi:hypothetical protein